MIKSFALAALIAVLLGFLGFQYYITSVPDLAEPITVEETRFIEQDQSLLLTLRGGEGRQFTVGLRGDIANDPEQTALPDWGTRLFRGPQIIGREGVEIMAKRAPGAQTVPQVFIDDVLIGGCDDLMEADANGKLDKLLGTAA